MNINRGWVMPTWRGEGPLPAPGSIPPNRTSCLQWDRPECENGASEAPASKHNDKYEDNDEIAKEEEGGRSMGSRVTDAIASLAATASEHLFGKKSGDGGAQEPSASDEGIVLVRHRPRPANRAIARVKGAAVVVPGSVNPSNDSNKNPKVEERTEDVFETVILNPENNKETDKELVVVPREEFVVVEQDVHY